MNEKTDKLKGLVQELQKGNFEAFTELYSLTHGDIETVCRSILKNSEDAQDAVQDTYITIYRSFAHDGIAEIHDPEKFLPWAKTIAKHTCLNQFNRNKKRAERYIPLETEDHASPLDTLEQADPDRDYAPEDVAENQFVRQCLEQSLETLPEMRRLCLTLHESGLTTREISEQLSIPEGTVKSHIRYAKRALAQSVRNIEKREKVSLHGLVWLPIGEKLVPCFTTEQPGTTGWISADAKEPAEKPAAKKPHIFTGASAIKVILAVVIAAGIIAGVVLIATHARRSQNLSATNTARSTVTSSSISEQPVNRPSAGNVQAPSQSGANAAPSASSAPARDRTNAPPTTAPAAATAPPSTAPTTTRRRLNGPVIPN